MIISTFLYLRLNLKIVNRTFCFILDQTRIIDCRQILLCPNSIEKKRRLISRLFWKRKRKKEHGDPLESERCSAPSNIYRYRAASHPSVSRTSGAIFSPIKDPDVCAAATKGFENALNNEIEFFSRIGFRGSVGRNCWKREGQIK